MSKQVQDKYEEIKTDLYNRNHTINSHNKKRFSKDTEHDWECNETVPGFVDEMLVSEGG